MSGSSPKDNRPNIEKFDWLQYKDRDDYEKGGGLSRILKNPFVPIGAICTLLALGYGLRSFVKAERKMSQNMMRARVVAQGFTLVALVGGVFYNTTRP